MIMQLDQQAVVNDSLASNGYALIEVLVASLVMALAATSFLNVLHTHMFRLSQDRLQSEALTLSTILVESARNQPMGWVNTGTTETGLNWQIQNITFEPSSPKLSLQSLEFVQIKVQVNWQGKSTIQEINYQTVRPIGLKVEPK